MRTRPYAQRLPYGHCDSRLGRLWEVRRTLRQGPASFTSSSFDTLTNEQRAAVMADYKIWSESWILPTIEAEIKRLEDERNKRKAKA